MSVELLVPLDDAAHRRQSAGVVLDVGAATPLAVGAVDVDVWPWQIGDGEDGSVAILLVEQLVEKVERWDHGFMVLPLL